MVFRSPLAIGSIATLSTLLLLKLKWDLDDNDNDARHNHHFLQLGRGMDHPLQASARGGGIGGGVGIEDNPGYIH